MFVGFDSHHPLQFLNWNLRGSENLLFEFSDVSEQIVTTLAYKITFSYSELHPVIFYVQELELCRA